MLSRRVLLEIQGLQNVYPRRELVEVELAAGLSLTQDVRELTAEKHDRAAHETPVGSLGRISSGLLTLNLGELSPAECAPASGQRLLPRSTESPREADHDGRRHLMCTSNQR